MFDLSENIRPDGAYSVTVSEAQRYNSTVSPAFSYIRLRYALLPGRHERSTIYQIEARFSGARYIGSPSCIPKASFQPFICGRAAFTLQRPKE